MQLFDDLDDFGSFDDAVAGDVRDPYTELSRIRRSEPVQRLDFSVMPGEEGKPVFMVYRHEDIQEMLRDNETYSSAIIKDFFGIGKHVMVGMDEPEHGRHRALVSKAFSPKALAHWESDLVARVGNTLIDAFAGRGSADLVNEFTFPYPAQIIAGLLGLPEKDYSQFQRWSISLLAVGVNPDRAAEATKALGEYLMPILADRRQHPRDDLTSGLAEAEIDGEKLSDEEIYCFLHLLMPAGVETTYRSWAICCLACCRTPINSTRCARTDRFCHRQSKRPCAGNLHSYQSPGSARATRNWAACRSLPAAQ